MLMINVGVWVFNNNGGDSSSSFSFVLQWLLVLCFFLFFSWGIISFIEFFLLYNVLAFSSSRARIFLSFSLFLNTRFLFYGKTKDCRFLNPSFQLCWIISSFVYYFLLYFTLKRDIFYYYLQQLLNVACKTDFSSSFSILRMMDIARKKVCVYVCKMWLGQTETQQRKVVFCKTLKT